MSFGEPKSTPPSYCLAVMIVLSSLGSTLMVRQPTEDAASKSK